MDHAFHFATGGLRRGQREAVDLVKPQDCFWPTDDADENVCSMKSEYGGTGMHMCPPVADENGYLGSEPGTFRSTHRATTEVTRSSWSATAAPTGTLSGKPDSRTLGALRL